MRQWSRHVHGSPLYVELCDVVADSDELLAVINRIENRPPPNVLFAAVHYLLLRREDGADLARFYRSLVPDPDPPRGVAEPFRVFVLEHEAEIVELGHTRYTQTNECRRCVALLPAIWATGLSRFHLVDVGTSAGLNLLVDRYRYRWDGFEWGDGDALVLETELRGEMPEPQSLDVLSRSGLDLNPIDAADPDERLWLEALIWPEHVERRQRLRAALDMTSEVAIEMVPGSALETLGPVLDQLPHADPAVVMHSFTLNQFSPEGRDDFAGIIQLARGRRPVARVSFEHLSRDDAWQTLSIEMGSGPEVIGQGHPHGEWIELYARP